MDYELHSQNIHAEEKRVYWLDLARVLAIVSITLNHALELSIFEKTDWRYYVNANSIFNNALYYLSRIGVPLFLFVTGALLVPRNYEDSGVLHKFFKHNWLSLLITTEIWRTIIFVYLCVFSSTMISSIEENGISYAIIRWVGTLFFTNEKTFASMWYMSMILLVYLMIPIISVFIKRVGRRYVLIICSVIVVIGMMVPNINIFFQALDLDVQLRLSISQNDLFSGYLVYIILGYCISIGLLETIKSQWLIAIFVVSGGLTVLFQTYTYSSSVGYLVRYYDIGVLASSAFLFELIRRKTNLRSPYVKVVSYLSGISFGIYFLHICIILGLNALLASVLTGYIKLIVLELASFVLSIIIIRILSKQTLFRKYVFRIK